MLFSEGVKLRRKQLKLSQSELSIRSGVPQSTISAIETAARTPTADTMIQIAKGLDCTVSQLLGEDTSGNKKKPTGKADGLDESLVTLLMSLPEKDVQRVRDFVEGLKAAHKE